MFISWGLHQDIDLKNSVLPQCLQIKNSQGDYCQWQYGFGHRTRLKGMLVDHMCLLTIYACWPYSKTHVIQVQTWTCSTPHESCAIFCCALFVVIISHIIIEFICNYCKISNISYTKSQTEMFLISSCSCLCPIHLSQLLRQEWRCSWSSADRRCSNCIWVINNLIAYLGATYMRGLTVYSLIDTGAIVRLPQWHWRNPNDMGKLFST